MGDGHAVGRLPSREFDLINRSQRSDPGRYPDPGPGAVPLVREELDRLGVFHPFRMVFELGEVFPDALNRFLYVYGDFDVARHGPSVELSVRQGERLERAEQTDREGHSLALRRNSKQRTAGSGALIIVWWSRQPGRSGYCA